MAMPEIDEVKDAALKYDKKALAKMVQMGQMSNTTAMMAAMMRDRIVQSEMKPPAPPTVADEVFQPAQGLAAVPTDPRMFQGMAGGGIVAMAGGGDVQRFQNTGFVSSRPLTATLNPEYAAPPPTEEELREYERLKNLGLLDAISETYMPLVRKVQNFFTRGTGAQGSTYRSDIAPPVAKPTFGPDIAKAEAAMAAQAAAIQSGVGAANRADPKFLAAGQEKAVAYVPAPKPPEKGLGATPEAAASPIKSIRDQAQEMAASTVKVPKVPTAAEFVSQQSEMDKLLGVERNLEATELKEIATQREALKDDRTQAANMRLLEAGLAILGGTSPYAFENIGKGASKALAGFSQDLKDIKKNETDLTNLQRQIRRAENEYKRNKSDKNLAELTRLQERAEDKTQDRTKMEIELELKLRKLGLDEEQLKAYKESVAQGGTSPIERIAKNLREADPNLTYEQSIQKVYSMQQGPKTEAQMRKYYADNYVLLKKDFPTVQDYIDSQMGGSTSTGPKARPLSAFN